MMDRLQGRRVSTARVFILVLGVLGAQVGCSTSETIEDTFEIDVPKAEHGSVLDTKLKILAGQAKKYPRRADLQYKIAAVHFQKEDFRASAKYLRKAIYIDPGHVRYHFDLGRVHLQMGEIDEASESFGRAIEFGGRQRWSGLYSAYGYTLARQKKWAEARTQFETCIAIDGRDPMPYYFLGSIADIQGDIEGAVHNLRLYLEKGGRSFHSRARKILAFHGVQVDDVEGIDGVEAEARVGRDPGRGVKPALPVLKPFAGDR